VQSSIRRSIERAAYVARLAIILLAMLPHASSLRAEAPPQTETPWRVVILHNADFLLAASGIMDQALRETLSSLSPRPLDVYGEVLDVLRYHETTEPELVALLRKKHSRHRVDLVMARAQGGLEFALKYAAELWPGAQIVFYNNVGDTLKAGSRPPRENLTGILIDLDPVGTLDLLQAMHPHLPRLYIVGGTAPYDLFWKRRVLSLLAERKAAFEATWLDDLALPDLVDAVGRLPADSVVLYTSMLRDARGHERASPQVAEMVAHAANVPVYGFLDTYIGRGIVGGHIPDFAAEGREAAKLALRVLQGEPASSIPIQPAPPARCVVDARALERWHIDEANLPGGCEVRYRQPSLWRDYRPFVLGAFAVLVLQSLLISGLLVQRRRLRQAKLVDASRRDEVERALAFERLLVDISASLLRGRVEEPETAVTRALRRIGEFLSVDRVLLWSFAGDRGHADLTHSWVADGVAVPPLTTHAEDIPSVFERVARGEVVAMPSIAELPAADRLGLHAYGTRSLLAAPLMVDGYIVGALSLASVSAEREWPPALIPRVQLIGEVFASVLTRRRYATKIEQAESETAQYRERLAHLVRVHTVGEMSAAIAHEVNQPLVAIANYALAARRRLGFEKPADYAKVVELLEKIGGQASRAGDVLKRLRSIVKRHESEASEIELGKLVTDTVSLVEMESRLKDIRIEVVVAGGLPPVLADAVQIQQVVLNLARNGIEAMDEPAVAEKVLRVEVSRYGEHELVVRVVDRGRGVDAADGEHIFEPFYSTKEQGLGIGLAICRSIVEAHGGKLSHLVDSAGRTVFQFTLPTAEEKVEP
jgi:C4-dicarboxylate-specific signal transduction histidine kinase